MVVSDPVKGLTDIELMAHLFRRAGFSATRDEIEAALAEGYEATIDDLVHPERQPELDYAEIYRYWTCSRGTGSRSTTLTGSTGWSTRRSRWKKR
jgi:hypothetical protein